MAPRLPFNKRDRQRFTQSRLGYRPTNDWGSGELPAPWAEGDIVQLTEPYPVDPDCAGHRHPHRLNDMGAPGFYVITYATSIDEGDAWYFRVTDGEGHGSDRLHVAAAARSEFPEDVDYMAPFTLIDTADPDGLAERERLLAEGWRGPDRRYCPACGGSGYVPSIASRESDGA